MPLKTRPAKARGKAAPASALRPTMLGESPGWTFLSNHAHVLICLALNADSRLRDVAARVGITERAVQKIVSELSTAGVLSVTKAGRRNHYTLHADQPLRHPVEAHRTIQDLVKMVVG